MKVLFLTMWDDHRDGGGGQVTLKHLTGELKRQGVEPVILSTTEGRGLHQIERDGVRVWRAGLRNVYWPSTSGHRPSALTRTAWHAIDGLNFAMQSALRKVLSIERPDVASVHQINGWSPLAWRTLASAGIPAVNVLHASESLCASAIMYRAGQNCQKQCMGCGALRLPHRILSNQLSAVVGVSKFILNRHIEAGYFQNVPIRRVIHNARNIATLGLSPGKHRDRDSSTLRFGFIGRIDEAKGIRNLLRAFRAADMPDSELLIAGNGKQDFVDSLWSEHSSDRVRFLGHTSQNEFFSNVDVVVVPSLWNDTLPGVVFEALAFGKPVIASRRGGIPEMVIDGQNGIIFEPDNHEELVAALQTMASDSALRARMGELAKLSAEPFIDAQAWGRKYVDLYEDMLRQ